MILLRYLFLFISLTVSFSFLYADTPNDPQIIEETMFDTIGGELEAWSFEMDSKWRNEKNNFIDDGIEDIAEDIGKEIFEELTTFNFIDFSLDNGTSFGVIASRKIYPNHDFLNSFTVVDSYKVPISIPLLGYTIPITGFNGLSAGLSLGVKTGFEIHNIRQAIPGYISSYPKFNDFEEKKNYFKDISFEKIQKFFTESFHYSDEEIKVLNNRLIALEKNVEKDEVIESDGILDFTRDLMHNPSNQARFGKIANIVLSPLKFPLKVEQFKKLHNGEILTFITEGMIHLNGNIGWSYSLEGIVSPVKAQISSSTYIKGEFRISIMKENERYVRLKIARIARAGISKSFYPMHFNQTILDSLAVVGVHKSISVVPFKFSSGKSRSYELERTFRFDIKNPDGQRSYEKAVFGLLVDAEQLAEEHLGEKDPPVKLLVHKTTNANNKAKHTGVGLKYIIKGNSSKQMRVSESKIIVPNGKEKGEYTIREGRTIKENNWSTIFGQKEIKKDKIDVSMDLDRLRLGEETSFGITAKFSISDKDTSSFELKKYIDKFEKILGLEEDRDIFKKFPMRYPIKNANENARIVQYGKSSLFLNLQYGLSHIKKFLEYPEGLKKGLIKAALNVSDKAFVNNSNDDESNKQSLVEKDARRIYYSWKKLNIKTPLEMAHLHLVKFFHLNGVQTENKMRVFNFAVREIPFSFRYSIYNKKLGRVSESYESDFRVDNISSFVNKITNFDGHGSRDFHNNSTRVSGLKSEVKDDGTTIIRFNLNNTPKFLYFILSKNNFLIPSDTIETVFDNENEKRFKKGPNTIILDTKSKDPFIKNLTQFYLIGSRFQFGVSVSSDKNKWSKMETQMFKPRLYNKTSN